ncbi:hypothetical protein CCACVL1_01944, partial [Corchorus capsularis]
EEVGGDWALFLGLAVVSSEGGWLSKVRCGSHGGGDGCS